MKKYLAVLILIYLVAGYLFVGRKVLPYCSFCPYYWLLTILWPWVLIIYNLGWWTG